MEQVPSLPAIRFIVYGFFFVSGILSLIYQVMWVRMLSLFFGSDAYAVSITLSVFMAGLALGSWALGRFGDRIQRPIILYGLCEVLISFSALLVPHALDFFIPAYRVVYSLFDSSPWLYQLFRMSIAALLLLFPTICMGATLPLLVRAYTQHITDIGRSTGLLYALNLGGACVGVVVAGFVLLPLLGMSLTLNITAETGLCAGVMSIIIGQWWRIPAPAPQRLGEKSIRTPQRITERPLVLWTIAVSGGAALALEVVWTRILIQIFGASVQAFSIMLACFLFGLFAGSALAGRLIDRVRHPLWALVFLQVVISGAVALAALFDTLVPAGIVHFIPIFGNIFHVVPGVASILVKFFLSVVVIILPAALLGATFPVAVRAFTDTVEERSSAVGTVYAANTVGAILGALVGGFVLLPVAGAAQSMTGIALAFLLNGFLGGVLLIATSGAGAISRKLVLTFWCVCVCIVLMTVSAADYVNHTDTASGPPRILYDKDGALSTVEVTQDVSGEKNLLINGTEVAYGFPDQLHDGGFLFNSLLPLMLQMQPVHVAVLGYGIGLTAEAAALYPGVESVRVIELNPDVIAAQTAFADINGNVLENPKVHVRIDDARDFMSMTTETFDMITTDPVHPDVAGEGYLYSKEYYQSIRAHLNASGAALQWVPVHNISPASFDVAVRTFVDVFPDTTVWYEFGQLVLVGTKQPAAIDCTMLRENLEKAVRSTHYPFLEQFTYPQLLSSLVMGPDEVKTYLARNSGTLINTDDNLYLEYHTPFESGDNDSEEILHNLAPYAIKNTSPVFNPDCSS